MTPSRSGRSIHIDGVTHGKAPIPMGARVGNLIYSSALLGKDPASDTLPAEAAVQMHHLFNNLKSLLASLREPLNAEWLACFPDPDDRPARHTQVLSEMPPGVLAQLAIVAVVPEGR
jgi:2-iminobutanoate/2-iminopropanoate deaminase